MEANPIPGTAGPLSDYADSLPLREAGWTPLPPIAGVLRWQSPDGKHSWPQWRALEYLREQKETTCPTQS